MIFTPETIDFNEYLNSSSIIDYKQKSIIELANCLSQSCSNEIELVKTMFEYVRDNIAHTFDIGGNVITCAASDVLKHKQGICYAKSHLLCALLRYVDIPAGFCYQKLALDTDKPQLVLHGLNAVYLKSINKWVRIDARGNKKGVNAEFSVFRESLAFKVNAAIGEVDIPIIFTYPSKNVISALTENKKIEDLLKNLPVEI